MIACDNLTNALLDTIMKITRDEAILLPNKTYPIKDQPGYYIAELDVFHQLHCLVSSGYIACVFIRTDLPTR